MERRRARRASQRNRPVRRTGGVMTRTVRRGAVVSPIRSSCAVEKHADRDSAGRARHGLRDRARPGAAPVIATSSRRSPADVLIPSCGDVDQGRCRTDIHRERRPGGRRVARRACRCCRVVANAAQGLAGVSVAQAVASRGSRHDRLPGSRGVRAWRLSMIRRTGLPVAWHRAELARLADARGVSLPVELLEHEAVPGPMTFGIRRPVIVLPLDAREWSEAELRRALMHEIEHIQRGDWLMQIVARTVAAVYGSTRWCYGVERLGLERSVPSPCGRDHRDLPLAVTTVSRAQGGCRPRLCKRCRHGEPQRSSTRGRRCCRSPEARSRRIRAGGRPGAALRSRLSLRRSRRPVDQEVLHGPDPEHCRRTASTMKTNSRRRTTQARESAPPQIANVSALYEARRRLFEASRNGRCRCQPERDVPGRQPADGAARPGRSEIRFPHRSGPRIRMRV